MPDGSMCATHCSAWELSPCIPGSNQEHSDRRRWHAADLRTAGMTDFHDDDDYRSRPRARPDPPRSANRQARDSQKRDSQADRGRTPDDELEDWPDEDSDLPDEE